MARRKKRGVRNWIQSAIKRPGAFTAKAKRAGVSVAKYAQAVLSGTVKADTTTKRQAALARTLSRLRRRRK